MEICPISLTYMCISFLRGLTGPRAEIHSPCVCTVQLNLQWTNINVMFDCTCHFIPVFFNHCMTYIESQCFILFCKIKVLVSLRFALILYHCSSFLSFLGFNCHQYSGLGGELPCSPCGCQGNRILWWQIKALCGLPHHRYTVLSFF